ncbi:hypothetical protein ES703_37640 [subsurface metagenome]
MSNKEVFIDENIRPYLNEIAERLWSTPSHATWKFSFRTPLYYY